MSALGRSCRDGGRGPLTIERVSELLKRLSLYDFAGKNEATIAVNWIEPLLGLLGYGQGTVNEILAQEPVKLRKPTRQIGSATLKIDYVPTVMRRRFWILEAKAAEEGRNWAKHLEQAWGYATHPEIDVPLMAIADGSRIAVYDLTEPQWDEAVVDIDQADPVGVGENRVEALVDRATTLGVLVRLAAVVGQRVAETEVSHVARVR
jgi:hypothetical protein